MVLERGERGRGKMRGGAVHGATGRAFNLHVDVSGILRSSLQLTLLVVLTPSSTLFCTLYSVEGKKKKQKKEKDTHESSPLFFFIPPLFILFLLFLLVLCISFVDAAKEDVKEL